MNFWESLEELPIRNWYKVLETGDYSYLIQDGKRQVRVLNKKNLEALWKRLQEDFIDRFGLSKKYVSIERKRLSIERLQLKYMSTGDKTLVPVIEVRKRELEAMLREQKVEKRQSLEEQVVMLESHYGFSIDTRKVSVARYYTYIQVYERELQRLIKAGNVK